MEGVNWQVFQAAAAIVGGNAEPGSRTTSALIDAEFISAYRKLLEQAQRIATELVEEPNQHGR